MAKDCLSHKLDSDKATGHILYKGISKDGLYPIQATTNLVKAKIPTDTFCTKPSTATNKFASTIDKSFAVLCTSVNFVSASLPMSTDASYVVTLKTALRAEFQITDLGFLKYFLGLEVCKSSNGFFVTQTKYLSDLLNKVGELPKGGKGLKAFVAKEPQPLQLKLEQDLPANIFTKPVTGSSFSNICTKLMTSLPS